MATYAKVGYNGKVQTVALFEGLNTEELTSLLKTVFSVNGEIVGLMAERGLVLPISLVAKSPSVVPNTVCKLLVSNAASSSAPRDKLLSTQTNKPVSLDSLPADLPNEESNVSEADSSEVVTAEIREFIGGLRERKFLTRSQADLLNSLLDSNSTLLFAAYSVAISANDSEYLAEICKDLAQSLVTEQGRSACEAQDEVLQVSDQLYINGRITENQLLYLRHLVLIREEVVASIYDDFQEHQSVPRLAKALYELCNTHPYQHARQQQQQQQHEQQLQQGDDEDQDEEEEEAPRQQQQQPPRKSKSSAQLGLSGVVSLMLRTKRITAQEASILLGLIRAENEYVMAAYELYESDDKIDELQDTLLRCAKLEARKKALEAREAQLEAQYQQRMSRKYDAVEDATTATEEEADGSEEDGSDEEDDREEEDNEQAGQQQQDDGEDEDNTRFTLEDIGLDSILESLDVVNIWESSVPARFIKTVFIAVIRKQLDIYQAKALCDLYHANYDLVRSAWEVFTVQEDATDLIDTLRRVVKDLTLDEDDEEEGNASSVDGEAIKKAAAQGTAGATATAKSKTAPTAQSTPAATKPASSATSTASANASQQTAPSPATAAAQAAMDRKQEALAAVAQAKRDLLKHSLEMMVKQGIVTGEAAANLYRRYLQGDSLAEAAIDAYASDRNVSEFLDTLQILANHSPAELSQMMKDVAEEAQENATSPDETAVNTRANSHISPRSDASTASQASGHSQGQAVSKEVAAAQAQLKGIVAELARNQMISAEVHSILNRLVAEPDARLILAFERYVATQEGAKLIDTLLHVAAAEMALQQQQQQSQQSQSQPRTPSTQVTGEQADDESEDEDDQGSGDSLLTAQDQKTVVDILARANALTAHQANALNMRVDAGDAHVKRIFVKYETDKDVYQLIDALKALHLAEQGAAKASEDEEDGEDQDEDNEEFDEDDGATVESKFLQIVQRMRLTHLETAALRLAIARDDAGVKTAIEAFRSSLDEHALMDALRNVARDTIAETLAEEDEDHEEQEQGQGQSQSGARTASQQRQQGRDEEESEEGDEEDYGEDDDQEDEEDDDEEVPGDDEVEELIRRYSQYNTEARDKAAASTADAERSVKASSSQAHASQVNGQQRSPQRSPQQQQEVRSKTASSYDYKLRDSDNEDQDEDQSEQDEDQSEQDEDQSEQDEDDDDDEDDEEDDEDEEGGVDRGRSLVSSQAARNHVFPILISELVKESILTSRQGAAIMQQFSENSPVISAAIDVYDRDSDLAHLVQTLQSAVEPTR